MRDFFEMLLRARPLSEFSHDQDPNRTFATGLQALGDAGNSSSVSQHQQSVRYAGYQGIDAVEADARVPGAYLKHSAGAPVRNFLVRQPALSIRAEVAHVAEDFYW